VIEVFVELRDGCLTRLRAQGHAATISADAGISVVCAAVSGVIRSAAETLARHDTDSDSRIGVSGMAPQTGLLEITVAKPEADADWLRGVTETLLAGVQRIAIEAPTELVVQIVKGEQHGS
jgi:uncharacterized protein YsxB (DUF464 family)